MIFDCKLLNVSQKNANRDHTLRFAKNNKHVLTFNIYGKTLVKPTLLQSNSPLSEFYTFSI
jgi:hypothetical protein